MRKNEKRDLEFAKACEVIEKKGGNVLEYIRVNYPSYTPRPVWYRLQRHYLNRPPSMLTEGHPTNENEGKETEEVKRPQSSEKTITEFLETVNSGVDPWTVLIEMGYQTPHSAMYCLRKWAKVNDRPDLTEQLAQIKLIDPKGADSGRYRAEKKKKTGENQAAETRASEPKKEALPAKDWKPEAGANYRLIPPEEKPGAAPTCCQPAKPSGVTVPDRIPDSNPTDADNNPTDADTLPDDDAVDFMQDYVDDTLPWEDQETEPEPKMETPKTYPVGGDNIRFTVKQLISRIGIWEYNAEKQMFAFAPLESNDRPASVMVLSINEWLNLAAEIPEAIKALVCEPN